MSRLSDGLITVFRYSGADERITDNVVNLVESQPVLDSVAVSGKQYTGIVFKETDQLAIGPAALTGKQGQRYFIMRHGNQRFNVIFAQFGKNFIIELQTFFVWRFLIPFREDSSPVD